MLGLVPKTVRPLDSQDAYESRRFWQDVTDKMLAKSWGEATASKQAIEQAQRDKAAERKANGEEFEPRYFSTDARPLLLRLLVESAVRLTRFASPLLQTVPGRPCAADACRTGCARGRACRRGLLGVRKSL